MITDIQMPVMSGLEMIAKARHKGLESRYLILSGYSEFQYARQALRLGVDDYLLKPIDPDALVEKLLGLAREIENKRAAHWCAICAAGSYRASRPSSVAACRREAYAISFLPMRARRHRVRTVS